MKLIRSKIALLLAGGLVSLAPGQVKAQGYYTQQKVSFSATYYEAAAPLNPANNGSGKVAAAKKTSVSTAELLSYAWDAETNNGNVSGKVPKNAVLEFNGSGFEIDQGTNMVADLSGDSILTFTQTGANDIASTGDYGTNGAGEAPFATTSLTIASVTLTSPQLTFTVTGFASIGQSVGSPNNKGNFTVSGSLNLSDGTGEGTDGNGNPFEMTGVTITASGKTTFNDGD